jgi:hypothetical protein
VANFSSLEINASGHLGRVTLCDTTTANADMRETDNALVAADKGELKNQIIIASQI